MEIICFLAGMMFFYFHALPLLLLPMLCSLIKPGIWFVAAFLLALGFGSVHEWFTRPQGMPHDSVITRASLTGTVASIPTVTPIKTTFDLQIETFNGQQAQARAAITCHGVCPSLLSGDTVSLTARLRVPRPAGNPAGFDYRRYLQSHHVGWTGTTRPDRLNIVRHGRLYSIQHFRQTLAAKLAERTPDPVSAAIMQALVFGVTGSLDKSLWELFRHTGTTHLMVISGAHIGLVSGIIYRLFNWLWRWLPWCALWPAQRVASIFATLFAFGYTLLSGFGAPGVRALVSCVCLSVQFLGNRRIVAWQSWRHGMLVVLLLEPHSVLMPGFYLSFLAVAVLMLAAALLPEKGVRKWLGLQFACLMGLMPASMYWFSIATWSGMAANLVAIPMVGMAVLPLSFLTVLVMPFPGFSRVAYVSDAVIQLLLGFLHLIDRLSFINVEQSFSGWLEPLCLTLAPVVWILLRDKALCIPMLLLGIACFFPPLEKLHPQEARVDVLDAGQGLAVVVRTAHHVLVYDTGAKFWTGGDMGRFVIIPFLRAMGVKKLDTVIVSHTDLDHRGGLESLESVFPPSRFISDNPAFYKKGKLCHTVKPWEWDGVHFAFVRGNEAFQDKNNRSCVLKVSAKESSMLLPGDIEAPAERMLAAVAGSGLKSTVLVLAHHGSKTSSTATFLDAVAPDYGIISAGFDNIYHFPHPSVTKAFENRGIPMYVTARCGMVSVYLGRGKREPVCFHENLD
ncbi:DNA internalization-related competence protein ComEC/Rec2 [Legionella geestiana]|nr:DNA internalization-related competence protein ComEC/Rec2 [Legionella geestiana]QBS11556.1 DNA internalization-related competence protein ComEC/Rec2 [Legionella geestiana]QDQ40836.1 DNA internalization-related competence protein ComEC/Rec2 [Legionella geestiana]STX53770.1 DNA uptake/competence protein ComA [Legionella geestiana]